jgi:hypothetical protein
MTPSMALTIHDVPAQASRRAFQAAPPSSASRRYADHRDSPPSGALPGAALVVLAVTLGGGRVPVVAVALIALAPWSS